MLTAVAIPVAGALGALARYGLDGLISRRAPTSFPWGTFVINVSGSFLLGLAFVAMTERFRPTPGSARLTIGFLGAYTTFSTLSSRPTASPRTAPGAWRPRTWPGQPRRGPGRRLRRRRDREGAVTKIEGEGKLLRIFIGESDTWHGRPLYEAIVHRVREAGWPAPPSSAASKGSAPTRACTPRASCGCPRTFRS